MTKKPYRNQLIEWDFDKLMLDLTATFENEPPQLEFVLPGFLLDSVGVLVSPGGLGKSMMLLQNAISIALGRDVFRLWSLDGMTPIAPGRVIIFAVEDPVPVLQNRMHRLGKELNEDERKLVAARVEIVPVVGLGFSILEASNGGLHEALVMQRLKEWAQRDGEKPRLIAFDTLNRCLVGAGENSSTDMGKLMTVAEGLCKSLGCAALLVHHSNKASAQSGNGQSQFAVRGSSAISDNCRFQMNLSSVSEVLAAKYGVSDPNIQRRMVRFDVPKLNYAPPLASMMLLRDEEGILRNFEYEMFGDQSGSEFLMIEFKDDDFGLGL